MRRILIAGNWKMNKTNTEAKNLIKDILDGELGDVDILICPTYTSLYSASELLKDSSIKLGAQNVSEHDEGAYTGEISASMLKDLDVEYIILGHSERRSYYNESSELIAKKAKKAIKEGFIPIICVGETAEERQNGEHEEKVALMLNKSLEGVDGEFIIAYEPIWAIGTGNTCSSEDAQKMCKFIRSILAKKYSNYQQIRILYGGSVKPANVEELMKNEDIDGALVGGASLKAEDFIQLTNLKEKK